MWLLALVALVVLLLAPLTAVAADGGLTMRWVDVWPIVVACVVQLTLAGGPRVTAWFAAEQLLDLRPEPAPPPARVYLRRGGAPLWAMLALLAAGLVTAPGATMASDGAPTARVDFWPIWGAAALQVGVAVVAAGWNRTTSRVTSVEDGRVRGLQRQFRDLDTRIAATREQLSGMPKSSDLANLRSDTATLRGELREEFGALRTEFREEIQGLRDVDEERRRENARILAMIGDRR